MRLWQVGVSCEAAILRWFRAGWVVLALMGLSACSGFPPASLVAISGGAKAAPAAESFVRSSIQSSAVRRVSLDGTWDFLPGSADLPAQDAPWQSIHVPGNWYPQGHDHAGYAWYRRVFEQAATDHAGHSDDTASTPATLSTLHFDGVDYFADVWLNGVKLGSHEGYFQHFSFDMTQALQAGNNTLLVRVNSPLEKPNDFTLRKRLIKGVFAHHDTRPGGAWSERGQEGNTGGIWGSVYWQQTQTVQLQPRSVQVQAVAGLQQWVMAVRLDTLGKWPANSELRWTLEPQAGNSDVTRTGVLSPGVLAGGQLQDKAFYIPVNETRLWYPQGYGEQNVYTLRVSVAQQGQVLDSFERPVAFRKLRKTPQGIWYLNDQRLLIKGTNYIAHQWLGEMSEQDFRRDIRLMQEAHINTVRVHAHVTSEVFYRLCDEAGLMVWQDFPLQWGYQDTPVLHTQAVAQVGDMVEQFGHHASIIQWTLHNEPPWDASWMKWKYKEAYDPEQNRVLDEALYARVTALDKTRPTEMISGTAEHPWLGWYSGHWLDYAKPTKKPSISEFGAQALPDKAALKKILGAEPVLPNSEEGWKNWEYHNFQPKQTLKQAKIPLGKDVDEFIKNTQQYQAWLIQLAAESYRRQAYKPVGSLFQFMLVENWPSMNWGVLDYWRTPKVGYFALQRAYQPVLPSLEWTKLEYPQGEQPVVGLWVLNDSFKAYPASRYELKLYRGETLLDRRDWVVDIAADQHEKIARYQVPARTAGEYQLKVRILDQQQVTGINEYRFTINQ